MELAAEHAAAESSVTTAYAGRDTYAFLTRCPGFATSLPVGAVAQLGERVVRNDEVRGSIPLGSTNKVNKLALVRYLLLR